jgi:hypothetical protein
VADGKKIFLIGSLAVVAQAKRTRHKAVWTYTDVPFYALVSPACKQK